MKILKDKLEILRLCRLRGGTDDSIPKNKRRIEMKVPVDLEKDHLGHYKDAIRFLESGLDLQTLPAKTVSYLYAQVNATLAVYKFLVEKEQAEVEAYQKAIKKQK